MLQHRTLTSLMLCALIAMTGCGNKQMPGGEPVVSVQAVHVQRSEIELQVSANGILYPVNQAVIVPKISAPIQKFYVQIYSEVA